MYQTITPSAFRDAFRAAGRADQFSYHALGMLFDYFDDVDPDHELDVIAICCAFSEDLAGIGVPLNSDNWGVSKDEIGE